MLGPEEPAQEGFAVPGIALLVGAALVALHAFARGLVLVGQVLLVQALLLLPHFLGVVLLPLPLDLFLFFLANAFLCMHGRCCGKGQRHQKQRAEKVTSHGHAAAKIVPRPRSYLCTTKPKPNDPMLMNPARLLLAALAIAFTAGGCKKEQVVAVPIVPVDIQINLNLPEYNALQVVGGWAYIIGGSEGLLVYRKSADEFSALDRHCTYQSADQCKVTVDAGGVVARDTACCHSAFLLLDGSVVQGPATFGLKQYHTTFNGQVLRIFN